MPLGTSYTIKDGMISDRLINCYQMEQISGISFEIKNQFLHAVHPLGWIKELIVEIDEKSIDSKRAFFILRGQWFSLDKLETITEVFWNLCETAVLFIEWPGGIPAGTHSLRCTFVMSMLEDTQILDVNNVFEKRVEIVECDVTVD